MEINRPDGQVEIGHLGVDSQAITEEAIAADSGLAEGSVQAAHDEGFAGADSVLPETSDGLSGAMHPDWQSAKTQKSRQIGLVIALSATGLIAAVMFFGWFVNSWKQQGEQELATVGTQTGDSPSTNPEKSTQSKDAEGVPAVETGNLQDQTASNNSDVANPNQQVVIDTEAPNSTELDKMPTTPDSATPLPPDATASNDGTGNKGAEQSVPSDLLPPSVLDPPSEIDPVVSDDDHQAAAVNTDKTDGLDTAPGMQELPPELAQYTQFLLDDGAPAKPTLQAPPTMEEVKLEAAAEEEDEDLRIPIVPKELDLRADLAIRLALASDGYPASDLMLLVSQVTGVPIQMDWPSFDLAGADIQQQVPTTKDWRSARELIDQAAEVLNAEIREQPNLLLLTLRDESFDEAVSRLKSVEDFGVDGPSAQEFLQGFLAGENRGANPREVSQLACFATEALRRMRGIAPQMKETRFRRWACEINDSQAEWTVLAGGDSGPQLDAPMSLAELMRRTAKRNQAICVFNWQDAVRRGAPPEHLLLPHNEEDAGSTLRSTLYPLGLQVRQVDSKHWWVGTEATYDRLPIFVWTPPLGQKRADFLQQMNKVMAGLPPLQYRLAIDDASGRALMLLPRFIVRQLPTIIPAITAK